MRRLAAQLATTGRYVQEAQLHAWRELVLDLKPLNYLKQALNPTGSKSRAASQSPSIELSKSDRVREVVAVPTLVPHPSHSRMMNPEEAKRELISVPKRCCKSAEGHLAHPSSSAFSFLYGCVPADD